MCGTASSHGIFSDALINEEFREIKNEMDAMMQRSLKQATITGKRYRIAFAPLYGYPSETAHFIRNKRKTDIEVIISKDGKFSLRVRAPGESPDCTGIWRWRASERCRWFIQFQRYRTVYLVAL